MALSYDIASDPEAQEHLSSSRARLLARPRNRERTTELALSGGFLVVAVALAVLGHGDRPLDLAVLAVLVVTCALVSRVEFEVGTGVTVPSVLLLFPMLHLLPAGIVPLAMGGGYLLSFAFSVARGERHVSRAIIVPAQAWHAVGPALVYVVAQPGAASWGDWPLALAALLAYLACDAVASLTTDVLGLGVPARSVLGSAGWVYLTDALLAPVGFALAVAVHGAPLATLVVLPLCGLLAIFAAERRTRLDHALELSQAYRGTALLLGDVVEADHEYTGAHSRDVVDLSLAVGRRLGLDARALRNLEFGALLHDVGKIAIPKEIIDKPGKLDEHEWGAHEDPHDRGAAHARLGRRRPRRGRRDRARLARGLRRDGVPRRPGRRGDPHRGAHLHGVRRLQRHAHRPLVPQGAPARRGGRRAAPLHGHAVRPAGGRRAARRPRRGRAAGARVRGRRLIARGRAPRGVGAAPMPREVQAAGGVVLREGRVAVVHRPKYDDWSLPKGKLDPGEGWEEAALREVEEETGLVCRLVRELADEQYLDGKGRPKRVRWWLMEVVEERPFAPDGEVDEVRWPVLEEALHLLSYEHDRALVRDLA